MNAFIYDVKSYSEVGSRDYLIASDEHVSLLFGSWFRNLPQKDQKLGEKGSEKLNFKLGLDL